MMGIKTKLFVVYKHYKDFGLINTMHAIICAILRNFLALDNILINTKKVGAQPSRHQIRNSISKKLKILLIYPPFHRLYGLNDIFFPIGLGYLASKLDVHGFHVRIYNMEIPSEKLPLEWSDRNLNQKLLIGYKSYLNALDDITHPAWQEFREVLQQEQPDVLGFTAKSPSYPSCLKLAEEFKKINPQGITVLGGPHATMATEDVLRDGRFDFVVRGEGEQTMLDLCVWLEDHGRDVSKIAGISCLLNGEIHHAPVRELHLNIDEFPFPAKDLVLFPDRYPPGAYGHIISSRGCPFLCGYCAQDKIWTRKVRFQTTKRTIAEIRELQNLFGISSFYFWDDSFTVNRERVIDLCNALIGQKFTITWNCTTRADLIDAELMDIMFKAGCRNIDIGIESGSERILKLINKGITVEKCHSAIEMIKKAGIQCNAFFMMGFPDETDEDIQMTLDLIRSVEVNSIAFSIYTPYPGSALYNRVKELDLLPKKINWAELSHHSAENYFVRDIPKKRFQEYIREAVSLVDKHNHKLFR